MVYIIAAVTKLNRCQGLATWQSFTFANLFSPETPIEVNGFAVFSDFGSMQFLLFEKQTNSVKCIYTKSGGQVKGCEYTVELGATQTVSLSHTQSFSLCPMWLRASACNFPTTDSSSNTHTPLHCHCLQFSTIRDLHTHSNCTTK